MNLRQRLSELPKESFYTDKVFFREINSEDALAIATCKLTLPPEQQDFVNPAGFSIGRAYLFPNDNVPYLIYAIEQGQEIPIGFILLRFSYNTEDKRSWRYYSTRPPRTNWSYFIVPEHQSKGYGRLSAELAIRILTQAAPEYPIELTTEQSNLKAQNLYMSLGFEKADELDGDDLVFLYNSVISDSRELDSALAASFEDIENGRYQPADEVFAEIENRFGFRSGSQAGYYETKKP